MNKRVISMLLALVCVFSLFAAVPAYADEPETPPAAGDTTEPAPGETTAPTAGETSAPTTPGESAEPTAPTQPAETAEPTPTPTPTPAPTPTPEPTPTPTPGPWYKPAMDYAKENGLLKGDEKGNMNPNQNATRAQIAAIITRVFGCTTEKGVAHFSDVSTDAWYYHELSVAVAMGIMQGDAGFTMRPNASITRQEAFAIIARAFCIPQGNPASLKAFPDGGDVADWAKATLAGMAERKLIKGDAKGSLYPKGHITRAEFAQVLYNLNIQFCKDPAKLPKDGLVVYTGPSPLDISGFEGRLFIGGGNAMTLNGDAPKAEIYQRMNTGATLLVNGKVDLVSLHSRYGVVDGTGSADEVALCAAKAVNKLRSGKTTVNYDSGLADSKLSHAEPVPALTPENRSVKVSVRYSNVDMTGAPNGKRVCTVRSWIDGVRQADRTVTVTAANGAFDYALSESLWKRNMPAKHELRVELLYGTDLIADAVTVPVKNYTDAEYNAIANNNAHPYRIEVVKNKCTVLVYGLDKSGNYSILHRAFVCSPGDATPTGTFYTHKVGYEPKDSRGVPWAELMGGVWGQYCRAIVGGVFFHSVFYSRFGDPSKLYYSAYNQLGTICSHGCVRVTCGDAYWMYMNCPLGTEVKIYNSSTLPVPKPTAQKLYSSSGFGWDPTDPDPNNPYRQ